LKERLRGSSTCTRSAFSPAAAVALWQQCMPQRMKRVQA
jgi:hypothetical protein